MERTVQWGGWLMRGERRAWIMVIRGTMASLAPASVRLSSVVAVGVLTSSMMVVAVF